MSEDKIYDVAVLGGGPGGYTAAFRAADLGLSVCLIEQAGNLGGTCLNVGCIPSKTLLHGAAVIEEAAEIEKYGITFSKPEIDVDKLRDRKNQVVGQLTGGLDQLCKARKIDRVTGFGVFKDKGSMAVRSGENEKTVRFTHAVIATGSYPFRIPGLPEDERIWDSTDGLELKSIPKRFLIIGGGIIGLEMAQIYHALGSEITIVEMMEHLIPPADKDLVQPLSLKLKKRYSIYTSTKVTKIEAGKKGITASFEGKKAPEQAEFDAVLVAVGRRPSTENWGRENIGLDLDEKGFVPVDKQMRTVAGNIFAIGDVVGNPMLAHKAAHEGKVAAEVIAGKKSAFEAMTIPSVAYTSPEIAWMGMTEKEAKEKGIEYKLGKFPWGASGRALSADGASGTTKVLFDSESGRIIGAGICGLNAGELIHEAVLALEMGADFEDISLTVHAHPTLAETFAFAAEIVDGSITDIMPPG
ncbi:MAG: dihydrolipoyl dehydrogenase [Spirochaetales bacterium]|nr:dihydrolipoyl dehydrogenase [Spirochaetales bacterium]